VDTCRALVVVALSGAAVASCSRKNAPEEGLAPGDAAALVDRDPARDDAGAGGDLDRRRVDPSCEGMAVDLLAAAADPRCAIDEAAYAALVPRDAGPDAGSSRLRQIIRRNGDALSLVIANITTAAIDLPIRLQEATAARGLSILAEDERHAVFELAPPRVDADAGRQAGDAGPVRTARVRLPIAGTAIVRFAVDPRIARRVDPPSPDAGDAGRLAEQLPKGRYVLHVGQLLTELETGPPARVAWDVK
jgi:hypothetical protein